jgi:Leucine-rich repeat (LRR) protein
MVASWISYNSLFVFAILISSCKMNAQINDVMIEYESGTNLDSILSKPIRAELNSLTIQVSENLNTWFSYGRIPLQEFEELNNIPSFRIKKPLGNLPWLGGMDSLESLTIKFLGLTQLPLGINELKNLKKLDISFNYLNISQEISIIKELEKLEELIVFGLKIDQSVILELKETNKKLSVLHSQEQHLDYLKRINSK